MTEHQDTNGVIYRTADSFTAAGGAVHAFSTRLGGVSTGMWESLNVSVTRGDDINHVRENYRRLCRAIGVQPHRVAKTHQVHGDVIWEITEAEFPSDPCAEPGIPCDGLITNVPGAVLTVFSADCTPVLLYDPVGRAVGAVHAGWRGTAGQIAGKAVAAMAARYGCDPGNLLAAIGPSIGPCCFETHGDVPRAMAAAFGAEAEGYITAHPGGKFHVDLKGLNALALLRSGVKAEHITIDRECTCCHPEKYWSHRRVGGNRGNQCAMIALSPRA